MVNAKFQAHIIRGDITNIDGQNENLLTNLFYCRSFNYSDASEYEYETGVPRIVGDKWTQKREIENSGLASLAQFFLFSLPKKL